MEGECWGHQVKEHCQSLEEQYLRREDLSHGGLESFGNNFY